MFREKTENLRIGLAFAKRPDGGGVQHSVRVSIGTVNVEMLELCRRRQKNVCVIRGVRLKMLENNCEQVVAFEALEYALLIRCYGSRIGVVNNNGPHRRICIRECLAQSAHVDCSGTALDQIRTFESRIVVFEKPARTQNCAATRIAPRSDQGR